MVSLVVGLTALALCCVLPIWTAHAVLVTVVTLLHRTARLEPRQAQAIQTHTGV
jgi:heme exporter protein D